jgi:hypothetical protein
VIDELGLSKVGRSSRLAPREMLDVASHLAPRMMLDVASHLAPRMMLDVEPGQLWMRVW